MQEIEKRWIEAIGRQIDRLPVSDEGEDAIVMLNELCMSDVPVALDVIVNIIGEHPPERVLNVLGAGPIEELLVHDSNLLDALISRVSDFELLRHCLAHVNTDDPSLEKRLETLTQN